MRLTHAMVAATMRSMTVNSLRSFAAALAWGGLALVGCQGPWNEPYSGHAGSAGVFYGAFSERPKHLDPARAYSSDEYRFIAQIYEPPLQYSYLRRPYELEPLSAARMPEKRYLNADRQVLPEAAPRDQIAYTDYIVTIRSGIRYEPHPGFAIADPVQLDLSEVHTLADFALRDSRELVAADFVHQIKRLADPHVQSPIFGLMAGYIAGLRELNETLAARTKRVPGDLAAVSIEGARVLDRYRYRIRLKGDYPQFIYWLAMTFFAPMPPEVDQFYANEELQRRNISLDWYPVGAGPYRLIENNPNRRMVLARNPNYSPRPNPLDPDGQPMPAIERAVYSLEKEGIPHWAKFRQGWYDVSEIGSDTFDQALRLGPDGLGLTEQMRARGIGLNSAVSASSYYFGFNWLDPVVGEAGGDSARLLRQAISIAVDFAEFVELFRNGRGIVAHGLIPPGLFGYREGEKGINPVVFRSVGGRVERRPLSEARRLMAQAGYADGINPKTGKPLLLHFDAAGGSDPDARSRFAWLGKQFRKIGIQLVVRATDYNRFREKMSSGAFQTFMWGWNADYPDPENFLFLLHSSQGKVRYGGENASNYANADFDRLFERMKALTNGPERQALIDQMVAIVRADAPWIWGYHPVDYSLHHAWLSGQRPNVFANNTLKYLRIDGLARERARASWNQPRLLSLLGLLLPVVVAIGYARRRWRARQALDGRAAATGTLR